MTMPSRMARHGSVLLSGVTELLPGTTGDPIRSPAGPRSTLKTVPATGRPRTSACSRARSAFATGVV